MFQFSHYTSQTPPLFLPEIGTFFNQELDQALGMIEALAATGVKAIKGEILHRGEIALDMDYGVRYYDSQSQSFKQENYRKLIQRKLVSLEAYGQMIALAKAKGLAVVMSVYDVEGLAFVQQQGVDCVKVASSNLSHFYLIEQLAKSSLPCILDTGRGRFDEIARAVHWFRAAGGVDLLIEHSPAAPPAPLTEHYLGMLPLLADTFGVPVGLSDHHAGEEMLLAATALGAKILEKGVIWPQMLGDQDTAHAMLLTQVARVNHQIGQVFAAISGKRRPDPAQLHAARMGIICRTAIAPGDVLSIDNLDFAWPVVGIGAEEWPKIVGQTAAVALAPGQALTLKDIAWNANAKP